MKRVVVEFLKAHLGTRRKELFAWLLSWSIGLMMTSIRADNSVGSIGFAALFILIPGVLLLTTLNSLFSPHNANEREKEPLLIDLIRQPRHKAKWIVLLCFLLLFVPILILKYVHYDPTINRFFVTAFSAFLGMAMIEIINMKKRKP